MTRRLNIGVLISGSGTNLQAILDGCKTGAINGRIVFVGTDKPSATGLERARQLGIPTFSVDYAALIAAYQQYPEQMAPPKDFDLETMIARQGLINASADRQRLKRFLVTRALAEAELLERMAPYPLDLLVLAGFMRTLTPYFIDRINPADGLPRIMNIHPALLPAFPGLDGYGDTVRYGCKVAGCTVHFVDYGEDTGPIIGQKAFPIEAGDTLETVRRKGLTLEWQLYPECIQLYAEGRLKLVTRQAARENETWVKHTVVEILPQRPTGPQS